jgi:integrase
VSARPVAAPAGPGWVDQLRERVRPEFGAEVLVPAPGDVILGSPACAVAGCVRSSRRQGLCQAHFRRWDHAGRPQQQAWAATADPSVVGHRPLRPCRWPGCRFGQFRHQLCYRHARAWDAHGRPTPQRWLAGVTPVDHLAGDECAIPGCALLAELDAGWCRSHHARWRQRGRPPADEFLAYCARYGEECFDLRRLPPPMRLEIQYALQCRVDTRRTRTTPRSIKPLLRYLEHSGVSSLLQRSRQRWTLGLAEADCLNSSTRAFIGYALDCLTDLLEDGGWEDEYGRDVWRLHRLGFAVTRRACLDFRPISPVWLRELAKLWLRSRISTGLALTGIRKDLLSLVRLSQLATGLTGSTGPAALTREVLEHYLARLSITVPHPKTRSGDISAVTSFLRGVRQHRWAPQLPAEAALYADDHPRLGSASDSRAISEYVLAQLENPAALAQLPDPHTRLIVEILIRTGLRIGDARRLALNCVVRDLQGAPYLHYRNHKMRREAMVPMDDELAGLIAAQQTHVHQRFPRSEVLFPRSSGNPDGRLPIPAATFNLHLKQWLATAGITDECGRCVTVTAHQFRHSYACRLINNEVPQEVVRRLLDHTSHTMTSRYARLADTTIRQQWERAQKINIRGEPVDVPANGPLADGAWMKENLARAKMALPNGYCGLPLQKSCPHANACLTCPLFVTTAEFLPQHHQQLDTTRALIAQAETAGHTRMAEMNRTVETNLLTVINTLEHSCGCNTANEESCCNEGTTPDAG